jgi:hypothetical protein
MLRKRALLTENVLTPQIQSFPFIGARYLFLGHIPAMEILSVSPRKNSPALDR